MLCTSKTFQAGVHSLLSELYSSQDQRLLWGEFGNCRPYKIGQLLWVLQFENEWLPASFICCGRPSLRPPIWTLRRTKAFFSQSACSMQFYQELITDCLVNRQEIVHSWYHTTPFCCISCLLKTHHRFPCALNNINRYRDQARLWAIKVVVHWHWTIRAPKKGGTALAHSQKLTLKKRMTF